MVCVICVQAVQEEMEVEASMLSEKCVCVIHRFIIYVCAGSISQTALYPHEQKHRQEEAVATGLEQPPPVQWKHKTHKCLKCSQALIVSYVVYLVILLLLCTLVDTDYYGYWHCPNVPDAVPVEIWKHEKKAQLATKRVACQHQQQQ